MSFFKSLARMAVSAFDPATCTECPKAAPGEDPAFATAVTALGAKLAMADGWARDVEQAAFFQVFQAEGAARGDVARLYDLARQTHHGFESYARRLAKRYAGCPQILSDVVEGLFYIAGSDGQISDQEETYLETVSDLFGLPRAEYRRIRAGYMAEDESDPYVLLGLDYEASEDEVRRARRERLAEFHPDRVRARGLPEDYVTLYTDKSARINAAFDTIMRERPRIN